jgi:hypothetical protein
MSAQYELPNAAVKMTKEHLASKTHLDEGASNIIFSRYFEEDNTEDAAAKSHTLGRTKHTGVPLHCLFCFYLR